MILSTEELKKYFLGTKKHAGYDKSVALYEELRVHAEGEYPRQAIEDARPSELDKSKDYRKSIFVPLAKETFNQIGNCISKIRRSSDWMIKFDAEAAESLPDDETPEYYLTKNYPQYTSYEQWLFSAFLKNYLMDAGAKILVKPITTEFKDNEYLKPFPFIFNSPNVLEYDEQKQIAIFGYTQKEFERKKLTVVNEWTISTLQLNTDGAWDTIEEYAHGLGRMPVVKTRAVFFKEIDGVTVNESRIQTIAPRLKEFAREYSDLQAEVVQHIHSERWQWATQICQTCATNGISSGQVIDKKTKKKVVCPDCKGTGGISASPFSQIVIRPTKKNMGEQDAPIPPAGYITKQTEIVKIQDERCDKHIYKALASLNMQFLMNTPLNQSGYAKDVDREELQNFVYHCGEDLIGVSDDILYLTNEYRYRVVDAYKNPEKRKELLPDIPVPEKFDLLSANYLIDEITKAATAKVNPIVVMQMQVELVNKKYYYDQERKDFLNHILELDPLTGLTEEEKMVRMQNAPESFMVNYLVSINIYTYLQQAVEENKDFYGKKYSEKMKILKGYAEKEMKESEPKKAEVDPDLVDPNLPPNGKPQPAVNE